MSFHRAVLLVLATCFATGMTSAAFACCDFAGPPPVAFAAPPTYAAIEFASPAPIAYPVPPFFAPGGCGGCGAPLAMPYSPPVALTPLAPAPLAVNSWDIGGCGDCRSSVVYAMAPAYVVNQGPEFSGPGMMVPFRTYSPYAGYAAPYDYPYISGPAYRYGYGMRYGMRHAYYHAAGPHYAYRDHPHHYRASPMWHRY